MPTFEVWAPNQDRVRLRALGNDHDMSPVGDGAWRVTVPGAGPGTDYGFLLGDDETPVPDPRSRWQPDGVHGLSRLHGTQASTNSLNPSGPPYGSCTAYPATPS